MDGGYREAEMMAKAGASFVVVMGRAHEATIRYVVDAGRDLRHPGDGRQHARRRSGRERALDGVARRRRDHPPHRLRRAPAVKGLSPMTELAAVVAAVDVPVQAVGGLTIEQAIECPAHGAPLVVLGAPLVIAANDFKPGGSDLCSILRGDLQRDPQDTDGGARQRADRRLSTSCPPRKPPSSSTRSSRCRRAPRDPRARDRRARRPARRSAPCRCAARTCTRRTTPTRGR